MTEPVAVPNDVTDLPATLAQVEFLLHRMIPLTCGQYYQAATGHTLYRRLTDWEDIVPLPRAECDVMEALIRRGFVTVEGARVSLPLDGRPDDPRIPLVPLRLTRAGNDLTQALCRAFGRLQP